MKSIKLRTTVNETLAQAVPELRPLPGQRVEMVAWKAEEGTGARALTPDEFLAQRLTRPVGTAPVTLEDMERVIAEGAAGRGVP